LPGWPGRACAIIRRLVVAVDESPS
jgi:hypothetical protein